MGIFRWLGISSSEPKSTFESAVSVLNAGNVAINEARQMIGMAGITSGDIYKWEIRSDLLPGHTGEFFHYKTLREINISNIECPGCGAINPSNKSCKYCRRLPTKQENEFQENYSPSEKW